MKTTTRTNSPRPSMLSLRMITLSTIMVLMGSVFSIAQTINVYGFNSSAFPKITADYVAFDATGNPITDLTATDFRVVETPVGGTAVDVSAVVTHSCVDLGVDPEASIIIVLDRSQSMSDDVAGKQRWEYAKDAVRAFVNRVKFVGQTRVSLVSFAGSYQVINEWVDNAQPILDSLVNLKWQTVTNYSLPFDHPTDNIYELFKKRPAGVPKYTFFLTDGHPNPAIQDEIKFVNDNSLKLQSQGIRFFSVTIFQTFTHWTLESLARATGGKSVVTDEKGLVDLFSFLALETQSKKTCQITWVSPYSCNEQGQLRNVAITMKRGINPTTNTQYLAPAKSVAKVVVSDPVLFCGDPAVNNSSFANVTFTAQNATLAVTTFNVIPATYFRVVDWNYPLNQGTFASFNLAPNAKRTIRIEFAQGASQAFRQALLSLGGAPCPPNVTLVGGTGVILLSSPVGGELFSTCDTVTIKWAGVLPTQPVSISYSIDGGTTWLSISPAATGLSYKWLPPVAGISYKVRVQVSPSPQLVWAKQLGGAGKETSTAVAVDRSGLRVYASGYFDGPTRIGTQISANLAGNIDGYVTEMDSDGALVSVLLLTGTGSNDERVIGVVTDSLGNWYVVGYFSSPAAQLGTLPIAPRGNLDTRNMFVYKFASNGALVWSNIAKGTATQSSFSDATDVGMRYDANGNPELIVVGNFQRYIEVGINRAGTIERGGPYTTATSRPYFVRYDVGGYPSLSVNATPPTNAVYKSKIVTDNLGFRYETGDYSGPKTFTIPPPVTLPNLGQTDVFVSKTGAAPASRDSSKTVFAVKSPQLAFSIPKETFPATPQGQSVTQTYKGKLANTGDFAVVVQNVNFAGANGSDFSLQNSINGVRIGPGKSLSLEIVFAPQGIGVRSALLEVVGNCNVTAQLLLEGTGLAPCVWESQSNVSLGKVPLAQSATLPVSCVLKNAGPLVLPGTLTVVTADTDITVSPLGPFSVPANGGCFNVTIDVAAATPGIKTVVLAYGLKAECGAPTTTITVEVVEPRVAIDSVDFGRVRVLTTANDAITVENLNADPARITSFTLSDPTNPHFRITLPAPQTLNPGAKITIPVVYTPQTRGAHSVNVIGIVQGQASQLVGQAKGFGFLPSVATTGYTFNAWTVGSTSPENTGKVVVRNTDPESSLRIESVDFETATTAFTWTGAAPTFPIILAAGSAPLEIPVSFTPQVVGANQVRVRVTHDAKPGPGPIPPYSDTLVIVTGVGVDQSDIPPISFNPTLTCVSRIDSFSIVNPSAQFPLNVQAPAITGDAAMLTIDQNTAFVIPPGQTKVVRVTFAPTAVGVYSASFTFDNDQNLRLNVTVSGQGITTPVAFSFSNVVTGQVGQAVSMPVVVSFDPAQYAGAAPTQFTLTFTHDPDRVRFNSLVAPQLAGWTFVPTIGTGKVDIVATTVSTPLVQGSFITPTFDIYLNADTQLPVAMSVSTPLQCLITSGATSAIQMKPVCFAVGRLIVIGPQLFTMKDPKNNPVRDELVVEYSLGFTVSSTFQIIDAVGNVIQELVSAAMPSGIYHFESNVSTLSSGVYFLRMKSGPYSATTQFMVVR